MSKNLNLGSLEYILNENSTICSTVVLENNSGIINVDKSVISDNITLFKINSNFLYDSDISISSKEEGLCIDITLDGKIEYEDCILEQKINTIKNTMYVKYVNESQSIYKVKNNTNHKGISIIIKDDFLEKYLLNKLSNRDSIQKNFSDNIPSLLKQSATNLKTQILAREIYNSPFVGDLHTIFLQSKVYEIIYNEFSDILQNNRQTIGKQQDVKFSKDDMAALYKAKSLICENRLFMSLCELSKKVALNEFKLKYGFKQFFHTSPGAMMLDYKMEEAKRLIIESECSITEIAQLVGYKYLQSFSSAFSKKFGVLPKDLMKSRKYYY